MKVFGWRFVILRIYVHPATTTKDASAMSRCPSKETRCSLISAPAITVSILSSRRPDLQPPVQWNKLLHFRLLNRRVYLNTSTLYSRSFHASRISISSTTLVGLQLATKLKLGIL